MYIDELTITDSPFLMHPQILSLLNAFVLSRRFQLNPYRRRDFPVSTNPAALPVSDTCGPKWSIYHKKQASLKVAFIGEEKVELILQLQARPNHSIRVPIGDLTPASSFSASRVGLPRLDAAGGD
jgi:hypothetical protein